jgi:hypothetical protein
MSKPKYTDSVTPVSEAQPVWKDNDQFTYGFLFFPKGVCIIILGPTGTGFHFFYEGKIYQRLRKPGSKSKAAIVKCATRFVDDVIQRKIQAVK